MNYNSNQAGTSPYKDPVSCRCSDIPKPTNAASNHLLDFAQQKIFLSLNHCNLPSRLLGSPTYQCHPVPLELDGVHTLHRRLFEALDGLEEAAARAQLFAAHMDAHFSLHHPQEAGAKSSSSRVRTRANYLRVLRGWGFSSEGREGAVLKGWAESRFGLVTRYHKEPLPHPESMAYARFLAERSSGLYGTHALEAQLDLVYSFVQYELNRRYPGVSRLRLYRGFNAADAHELLSHESDGCAMLLLNNLSSFSLDRERADEFGDRVIEVCVPLSKIFCMYGLIPGLPRGEAEAMVLGGVYALKLVSRY